MNMLDLSNRRRVSCRMSSKGTWIKQSSLSFQPTVTIQYSNGLFLYLFKHVNQDWFLLEAYCDETWHLEPEWLVVRITSEMQLWHAVDTAFPPVQLVNATDLFYIVISESFVTFQYCIRLILHIKNTFISVWFQTWRDSCLGMDACLHLCTVVDLR